MRIVCVIDDDASRPEESVASAEGVGLLVQAFSSAQQFLRQLSDDDGHIGCLVVDVYMPGMSGVELRGILERSQRRFPIIFLTGVGGDTLKRRVIADGAVCVLEKPFDDVELRRAIEGALLLPTS